MKNSKKCGFREAFTVIELTAVIIVVIILAAIAIPKYFDYRASVRKTHSIDFPPISVLNNVYTAHEGDYITINSNSKTGPTNLVQGIWKVEKADRSGDGSYQLKGHRSDSEGTLTRVTLTLTTNQLIAGCREGEVKLILAPKGTDSYDKAAAAFNGNDYVAKDPK